MKLIKNILVAVVICAFALNFADAQNQDILFTIGGRDTVTLQEFKSMYERNSANVKDNTSVDDYLDLYINYKLKLLQAKDAGLDKDSSTIRQVEEYRTNLIKPYINDPKVMDSLAKQAYDRLRTLVRVSQILVSIPANVAPQDTVQYYQKAKMIYQKALNGESFSQLVEKYSDDPSANTTNGIANHGDMGYFTSMVMIYPFENACYSLIEKNKTAKRTLEDSIAFCRTQFGYHIIKLTSAIEVSYSALNFAHIFINGQKHSEQEAEELINKAYNSIASIGFDSVAKAFSEDSYTSANGGVLTNQRPNAIPAEYVDLYETTPDNQVTEPFKTRFGWHIVKYTGSIPIPEFYFLQNQIYDRISKDDRAVIAMNRFIDKSKKDYNFTVDSVVLKQLANVVTDSVFSATWQIPSANENKEWKNAENKFLFSVGNKKYTTNDLIQYIFENQYKTTPVHIQTYINSQFDNYSKKCVLDYASDHIELQYPKIGESVKEFENGVLIFDLTDKMVWSKSLSDSAAVEEYYQKNKSKYLYTERADAVIWTLDPSLDVSKVQKIILKSKKKGKSNDEVTDIINKKYAKDGKAKISYTWGRFEKGFNNIIDKNIFSDLAKIKMQTYPYCCIDTNSITNRNIIIVLNEMMPVSVKPLSACKGLVTSDYQDVLEKRWYEELKTLYPVRINYDVLNKMK